MLEPKSLEQRVTDLEKKVNSATEFSGELTEKGKSVNRGLKDKNITKGEELAIIRKAVKHLINKYGAENDPELAEFLSYNEAVELTKAEVSAQLERK